jgi:hypothetical protein
MAADVKAPRIVRETTNMERAAKAAAIRENRSVPEASFVDPDLIDNSLGELQVARVFMAAADNFLDEIRLWVRRDGFAPNAALCEQVDHAVTLLSEADDKIGHADDRLRTALDHSLVICARQLQGCSDPQRFAAAMHHYRMTYLMGQGFYLLNYPGDDGDFTAFEPEWDKHVADCRNAARAVLRTPASSAADMAQKQVVIDQQEAIFWDADEVAEFTRALIADAIAFAGGAA